MGMLVQLTSHIRHPLRMGKEVGTVASLLHAFLMPAGEAFIGM